ncbi:MAG: esterase-like activity of phytase family protein [Planctomycetota bacterium]
MLRRPVWIAGLWLFAGASGASAQSLELLAELSIEGFARAEGLAFAGISGLDYDPQSQRWIAVSNDSGTLGPVRFFGMRIELGPRGFTLFELDQAQALNHSNGEIFESGLHQPGSVRIIPADPPGDEPYLVWTSEGVLSEGKRAGVFEMCTGATFMDWFETPGYLAHGHDEGAPIGPRPDRAYESIALMPDHSLIAAFEQPLAQDGPPSVAGSGTVPVRLVHFDYWSAAPKREYVYELEEPPAGAPAGTERSLVELIAVDDNTLVSIESIMVPNQGRSPRAKTELYLVELAGATDVHGTESLRDPDGYTPVIKRRLGDTDSLGLQGARYNAGAFWHELGDGRQALVLVSDNANDTYRPTYFAALAVEGLRPLRPYVKTGEDGGGRHARTPGPHMYEARPLGLLPPRPSGSQFGR